LIDCKTDATIPAATPITRETITSELQQTLGEMSCWPAVPVNWNASPVNPRFERIGTMLRLGESTLQASRGLVRLRHPRFKVLGIGFQPEQ